MYCAVVIMIRGRRRRTAEGQPLYNVVVVVEVNADPLFARHDIVRQVCMYITVLQLDYLGPCLPLLPFHFRWIFVVRGRPFPAHTIASGGRTQSRLSHLLIALFMRFCSISASASAARSPKFNRAVLIWM
jgi:hypothetical protein